MTRRVEADPHRAGRWFPPVELDDAELRGELARALPDRALEQAVRVDEGHVATIYRLSLRGAAGDLALRIVPRGPAAWRLELGVMGRLAAEGFVPPVLAAGCRGVAHAHPWLLTPWMPGERLDRLLHRRPEEAPALGGAVGRAAARVHARQLAGCGRLRGDLSVRPWPESPFRLRLRRWLFEEKAGGRLGAARCAAAWELVERSWESLGDHRSHTRLLHGDLRASNLLLDLREGQARVRGLVDWEWAEAGDPLQDWAVLFTRGGAPGPAFERGFLEGYRAAGGQVPEDWRRRVDLYRFMLAVEAVKLDATAEPERRAAVRLVDEILEA